MTLRNKINGIKEIWQFDNRIHLLLSRLFFSKETINIYYYKGLEILVDHSAGDSNGAREVLTSDMYRKYLKKMKLVKPLNFLDLGANNGGFALLLKSENIEINKFVCVEFNPKTFSRLRFNIERNFSDRFKILNVAICGKSKLLNVNFGEQSTSDSIFQNATNNKNGTQQIEGVTFDRVYLDNFNNEIIDICKMDIEGAEFEVFQHNEYSLIKNCRYILIEIHHESDRSREVVREKLKETGFEEIEGEDKSDNFHHVHFFINKNLN